MCTSYRLNLFQSYAEKSSHTKHSWEVTSDCSDVKNINFFKAKKTSNLISKRSGSENRFKSCQDLMDIGEIREDWRSQSPSAIRALTQRIKRKLFQPHVESWLGFDSKLNQCSAAVALPQLVVLGENWILGDRIYICWKKITFLKHWEY